ncbi:TPA: hypothetical protein DDZ86_01645 [Candidatus Dependentiae bacterium]|nr:MAG: hypothetical protein UW09_C0001G0307 [candidate division TM6 bacterium GW2011_GWF2_43_87]HBL98328.1 hypothetical protein [Candidatus Dependentiae bacterium]
MKIKAYFFLSLILIIPCFYHHNLHTEELLPPPKPSNSPLINSSQDFDAVSFFDTDTYTYTPLPAANITRSGLTPINILEFVNADMLELLQKNFYKYTHPVNVRPLLELPALRPPQEPCGCHKRLWNFNLFYNQTRKQYLTSRSPYIKDYLAFSDKEFTDIFDKIADIFHQLAPDQPIPNLPEMLHLFDTIKFEERRAGAIFSALRNSGPFSFYAALPLYFIEHNFYVTPGEQNAIANSDFFRTYVGSGGEDHSVEDFLTKHVVHDFFGFGDLRLNGMWNLEKECSRLRLGVELSLPTSAIMTERMIGGPRCMMPTQPDLDIVKIANQIIDGDYAYQPEIIDLGVNALDRLILVTGDTRLGEEQVRFGPRIDFDFNLSPHFVLHQMMLLEYQPRYTSTRFFREAKYASLFNRDYKNPNQADQNIQFLEQRIVNMLYPPALETRILPTCSLEYTLSGQWMCGCVHGEVGYDLWYRTREGVEIIESNYNPCPFDIQVAPRTKAMEHKLFGSLLWRHEGVWHTGDFGASLDGTIANKGIGKSLTVSLIGTLTW